MTTFGSKRVVVGAHYGLRDWLAQRVTAAIIAVYSVIAIVVILSGKPFSYPVLKDLFAQGWMRVATLLFAVSARTESVSSVPVCDAPSPLPRVAVPNTRPVPVSILVVKLDDAPPWRMKSPSLTAVTSIILGSKPMLSVVRSQAFRFSLENRYW